MPPKATSDHDFDTLWIPSDLEQCRDRIKHKGNEVANSTTTTRLKCGRRCLYSKPSSQSRGATLKSELAVLDRKITTELASKYDENDGELNNNIEETQEKAIGTADSLSQARTVKKYGC